MLQKDRSVEPAFPDPAELLYRRCDPSHIEAGRVLPIAVEQFNLSVLRSRFCSDPDHARWDSRVAARHDQALVYPDWLVVQFSVADASLKRVPSNPDAQVHTLRPVHAPYQDNYAHSELALLKGDPPKRIDRERDAKGEGKLAKKEFRTILADRARISLRANEGSSFTRVLGVRTTTRRLTLRIASDPRSARCGRLRAGTIVDVLQVKGRWMRVRPSGVAATGWVYRRRLRRR